jgi:gamma-glutamyl:cysteine ligase YbdK (ATP-grasp superfamily)
MLNIIAEETSREKSLKPWCGGTHQSSDWSQRQDGQKLETELAT